MPASSTHAKAAKPVGDDRVRTVTTVQAAAPVQSLAESKEAHTVPAAIKAADEDVIENPFSDKTVAGTKAASTLWYN